MATLLRKMKNVFAAWLLLMIFTSAATAQDSQASTNNTPPATQASITSQGPSNDLYTNAAVLKVNENCTAGSLKGSSTQSEEPFGCMGTPTRSIWYRFVATASNLYIEVEKTSAGGQLMSAIWNGYATWDASSLSTLSCDGSTDGRTVNIHNLSRLDVGNTYYIQVACATGTSNDESLSPDFCVYIGTPDAATSCSGATTTISQFTKAPSMEEVISTCKKYELKSRLNKGQWRTACFNFTAAYHSMNIQMVINAVGGMKGNVTDFNWTIHETGCQKMVASGNMSNLNAYGLTEGKSYSICYNWQAACQQNSIYPYLVNTPPTAAELTTLFAEQQNETISLKWTTASETNNNQFEIERSIDGKTFKTIQTINGAGTNNGIKNYSYTDATPAPGNAYYRLKQAGPNNTFTYSKKVAVNPVRKEDAIIIVPNPVKNEMHMKFFAHDQPLIIMKVADMTGTNMMTKPVPASFEGLNIYSFDASELKPGIYTLFLMRPDKTISTKFTKQ